MTHAATESWQLLGCGAVLAIVILAAVMAVDAYFGRGSNHNRSDD